MPKIIEMFAFIIADKDENDEGTPAFQSGNMWAPMVGADLKRIDALRGIAQEMADASGKDVVLKRFAYAETLDTIRPKIHGGTKNGSH